MSNDKPCAIATIKFYPNKHVEVKLTDIVNVTPRSLDIASNILSKTYRGMRQAFNAKAHAAARETAAKERSDRLANEANEHAEIDARNEELAEEALAAANSMPKPDLGPDEDEKSKVVNEVKTETTETKKATVVTEGDGPVVA